MNIRPLHDRIVIQRLEGGKQKVGGIIIPTPPRKSRSKAR
jgi:co-chaperonin GroES (HSP10)